MVAPKNDAVDRGEEILVTQYDILRLPNETFAALCNRRRRCEEFIEIVRFLGIVLPSVGIVGVNQRNTWIGLQRLEHIADALRHYEIVVADDPNILSPRLLAGHQ